MCNTVKDMNNASKYTPLLDHPIINIAFLKKDHFLAIKGAGMNCKMFFKETVLRVVPLEVRDISVDQITDCSQIFDTCDTDVSFLPDTITILLLKQ